MGAPIYIPEHERNWAAFAHLSGFGGYLIPGLGIILPIVLMILKADSRIVSSIAKQAIFLNVATFIITIMVIILWISILGIPVAIVMGITSYCLSIALPIIGALKSLDGTYFKYPVIGRIP